MYRRLKTLIRILTFTGLGIMWGAIVLSARSEYTRVQEETAAHLLQLSQSVANQTENLIGSIHLMMTVLDGWLTDHPGRNPRTDREFIRLVETYRTYTGNTIDIRMVSSTGQLFYIPSPDNKPRADVRDREYYLVQQNPATRAFYIAPSVKSRVTGIWGIPLSYPLRTRHAGIDTLFAAVELPVLETMFRGIVPAQRGSIAILRQQGDFIFRTPAPLDFVGRSLSEKKYMAQMTRARQGSVIINNSDTGYRKKIIAFSTLQRFPLTVTVAQDHDAVIADWIGSTAKKTLAALCATLLIAFLSFRLNDIILMLEASRRELEFTARHDSLTGLPNRRFFFDRTAEEIERGKRSGKAITLMLLDVDHFKQINDRFGHPEGDRILREISAVVRQSLRITDVAGRMGGEEFAITLGETAATAAAVIAERIRNAVSGITIPDGTLTISIGIAEHADQAEAIKDWYRRADEALYRAKEKGRDRVEFWIPNTPGN